MCVCVYLCVFVPSSSKDIVNFDKAEFGLLPVRVETWGPFVYVNVSGDAPPLEEYLGRVTGDLALYPFGDLVTVRQDKIEIKANWKLMAENFMDFYHVPVRIISRKVCVIQTHSLILHFPHRRFIPDIVKYLALTITIVVKETATIFVTLPILLPMPEHPWIWIVSP